MLSYFGHTHLNLKLLVLPLTNHFSLHYTCLINFVFKIKILEPLLLTD